MRLLIAGAGGHGRVVADTAAMQSGYSEIAFLDDRFPELSRSGDWPVVGKLEDMARLRASYESFTAAFGNARLRIKLLDDAVRLGFATPVIVHPRACLARAVAIGGGTVVMAGAVVNIGASIGRSVIINSAAVVEHDVTLGDGVHVSPGACIAGEVSVGARSWIGIGSVVRQCLKIGSDVTLGAGAVCVADIPSGQVAVGVPAKVRQPKA